MILIAGVLVEEKGDGANFRTHGNAVIPSDQLPLLYSGYSGPVLY
jgi:hypothetical protein